MDEADGCPARICGLEVRSITILPETETDGKIVVVMGRRMSLEKQLRTLERVVASMKEEVA